MGRWGGLRKRPARGCYARAKIVAYTYARGRHRRALTDVFLTRELGEPPIARGVIRLGSPWQRRHLIAQVPPALRPAAAVALEQLAREAAA